MTSDREKLLEIARSAAVEAGETLKNGFSLPKEVKYKGEIDIVTQYDLASEKLILERLTESFPDHDIITEESDDKISGSDYRWYVDPLDGTVNFAHGFPMFCVSIACESRTGDRPELLVGVVYDPIKKELFQAIRDGGAWLNDQRLTVGDRDDLNQALLATGFPYDIHQKPEPILGRFKRMIMASQGVRRPGSAALDLAWTAAGRLDGFWEDGLYPWDTAAGALLVMEAGGVCTDFKGNDFLPTSKEILATNHLLHYNMHRILMESL